MAIDAQGADRARPWPDRAGARFTTVVDEENLLGQLYGFKAIPNGFLIDEVGDVAYRELGSFDIRDSGTADAVRKWVLGGGRESVPETADGALGAEHSEANALFREGVRLYRRGKIDDAIGLWRQGIEREPDNYIIRKQVWALENPEKFYEGRIDYDWQDEQLAVGR